MSDKRLFTLVFEGDISAIRQNFFHEESEFGRCVAAGVGNAFEDIRENAARIAREWGDENGFDLRRLAEEIKDRC